MYVVGVLALPPLTRKAAVSSTLIFVEILANSREGEAA